MIGALIGIWSENMAKDSIGFRSGVEKLGKERDCSGTTKKRDRVQLWAREKIVEEVKGKLNVDDYLSSSSYLAEGLEEAVAVERVLSGTDLHLQGWISNSHEFTQAIMKDKPAKPGSHQLNRML